MEKKKARMSLIIICVLFGTIGTFSRFIEIPSTFICMVRSFLAVLTMLVILIIKKQKLDIKGIKANFLLIAATGICMCFNWGFQFESFKYTSIATATLCYYMQPVFFVLGAALIYRERLSLKKAICIAVAFIGMIFVSGVIETGFDIGELKGVIFAVIAALFYAIILLITKSFKNVSTLDTTFVQLSITAIAMLPYVLITEDVGSLHFTLKGIICVVILGVVHTGIAYSIYFETIQKLEAETVGIISYIDPVVAIFLSTFFLGEPLSIMGLIGAALILGATAVSELTGNKVKD